MIPRQLDAVQAPRSGTSCKTEVVVTVPVRLCGPVTVWVIKAVSGWLPIDDAVAVWVTVPVVPAVWLTVVVLVPVPSD